MVYYNKTAESVTINEGKVTPKVETVDLGFTNSEGKKILWCTRNIGASSPEEYGKYFQWGDTVGYEDASHSTWATAPFNNGSENYDSTYFASIKDSIVTKDSDGNYNLNAEYDAVTVAYGKGYRLPTYSEYTLLTANTTSTWETLNGVKGIRFTSKVDTSKSIFVPAAGYAGNGSLGSQGSNGYIWSSSLDVSTPINAWRLYFGSSGMGVNSNYRMFGFSLRGVLVKD